MYRVRTLTYHTRTCSELQCPTPRHPPSPSGLSPTASRQEHPSGVALLCSTGAHSSGLLCGLDHLASFYGFRQRCPYYTSYRYQIPAIPVFHTGVSGAGRPSNISFPDSTGYRERYLQRYWYSKHCLSTPFTGSFYVHYPDTRIHTPFILPDHLPKNGAVRGYARQREISKKVTPHDPRVGPVPQGSSHFHPRDFPFI